jgi:hypothetical protein
MIYRDIEKSGGRMEFPALEICVGPRSGALLEDSQCAGEKPLEREALLRLISWQSTCHCKDIFSNSFYQAISSI